MAAAVFHQNCIILVTDFLSVHSTAILNHSSLFFWGEDVAGDWRKDHFSMLGFLLKKYVIHL